MGWIPDLPGADWEWFDAEKMKMISAGRDGVASAEAGAVDFRDGFPEIYDQGAAHSSPAQAVAAVMFYLNKSNRNISAPVSRLFIYKVARNLLNQPFDRGVTLGAVMETVKLIGAPTEAHWPYDLAAIDLEPKGHLFPLAERFRVSRAFRLDGPDRSPDDLLDEVRRLLRLKLPLVFGFFVPTAAQTAPSGWISYPEGDAFAGAQSVVACGYDDTLEIPGDGEETPTKGALLIRNSWGQGWGDGGYGWLPYRFVTGGLTSDWWLLVTGLDNVDSQGGPPGAKARRTRTSDS